MSGDKVQLQLLGGLFKHHDSKGFMSVMRCGSGSMSVEVEGMQGSAWTVR